MNASLEEFADALAMMQLKLMLGRGIDIVEGACMLEAWQNDPDWEGKL